MSCHSLLPEDLPNPGIELLSLISPTLAGRFFTASATWEAYIVPGHGVDGEACRAAVHAVAKSGT